MEVRVWLGGTSRVTCRNFQKVHIQRLQICRLLSHISQIRTGKNARMRMREDGNFQTIPRSMSTHKSTLSGWHKTKQRTTLAQTANLKQSRTVKRKYCDQMINWEHKPNFTLSWGKYNQVVLSIHKRRIPQQQAQRIGIDQKAVNRIFYY